jgi:amidase
MVNALEGFATEGVVSRTVADTAALLDVIGRPDPLFWYTAPPPPRPFAQLATEDPGRLRVGLSVAPLLPGPVDPEVLAATEATARVLAGLGHDVMPVELAAPDPDMFTQAFMAVWNTGSAGLPLDHSKMEPLNIALRDLAKGVDSATYVEAVYMTQIMARGLVAPFGTEFDVLLTPTMACLPLRVGEVWNGADVDPSMPLLNCFPMAAFTAVWNITGMPAISLPMGVSSTGVPIGVQLVGGPWQDAVLLQVATQLEAAAPWVGRRPVVC